MEIIKEQDFVFENWMVDNGFIKLDSQDEPFRDTLYIYDAPDSFFHFRLMNESDLEIYESIKKYETIFELYDVADSRPQVFSNRFSGIAPQNKSFAEQLMAHFVLKGMV